MIWEDPFLPTIRPPTDLKSQWFQLGSAKFQLLPKQYVFLTAQEEFLAYISGYGGGKTRIGVIKAAYLSMHPDNRGLVGMEAATDLHDTAQRDLLEFLHEAELLKKEPAGRQPAYVHCIDPLTGRNLGYTAEIHFKHLDDPKHVRGRHLGWVWVDEGSKVKREAWQNLIGRLRLPVFRNRYKAYVTGNPEGHNWIWDFFFDRDKLESMICNKPDCRLSREDCNRRMRLKRRAIHATSYQNYFLPPDYVDNMLAGFTDEERLRYIEASFDVFEGQIFKEFQHDVHVLQPPASWPEGRPPKEWNRLFAVDVGGATAWAFLWCAVDPDGNLIFYDEINEVTSDVDRLADRAAPKMRDEDGIAYTFQAKVIDYENKIAAYDLGKRGIVLTNARKHDKMASVNRLHSYLHRNPKHHYPPWHPRAGEANAPRAYVLTSCQTLIRELPQQRYLEQAEFVRDEMDRRIRHDSVDCALYIVREVPHPTMLKPVSYSAITTNLSKISELYWYDRKRHEAEQAAQAGRKPYRIQRSPLDIGDLGV